VSRSCFDPRCGESDLRQPLFKLSRAMLWLLCLGALAPATARAQPPIASGELEAVYQRLDEQDQEIRRLREQLAGSLNDGVPPAPAPSDEGLVSADALAGSDLTAFAEPTPADAPKKGDDKAAAETKPVDKAAAEKKPADDWIDLSAEKWTIKLGGHVQMDFIQWAQADPPIPADNYFEFRRLRLLADGTGYGVFDFRIQMDIEPEGEDTVTTPVTVIKDAYLTMHEVAFFQRLRIGNFFVPFSLEQVTNDTNNIFMERSIPTQGIFAADREVGIAMYGVSDDLSKTWTFGAFIDSVSEALKERIDDNQGHRLSGRFTWVPFYDEPSNGRYLIHTGAGILYTDDQDSLVRFSARPQIHEGPRLIDSGNRPAGSFTTGNLEFATVWGPLSFQSEAFVSTVNLIGDDRATLYGAYGYLSYFVTGENRVYERYGQHGAQFARNVPRSNFFLIPGGYGPGALELKARTSYLDLNSLNAGQYNDLTVGFNWYWTDRVRTMFDWIHPWTTQDTPFGDTQSDIIAMRFDFNF
jgi:phosphate-selective porin OprO and OprP